MEPLEPSDPARIGAFRLTHRLGEGGMGRVYLARTASGRQVAVKVIRSGLVQDSGFRARFAREVDAARRVGGFHTASVVDADLSAAPPWIATAYIAGPTLYRRVREHGPIAPPALHTLVVGLAEGLKAVHDCGLVHRDLKPGNVILSDDGPRIIDFGIARPLDAESLTTREAVFGTLPYMSPEQTDGSRVGPASDVFSLGTVLAFAATGANPFKAPTMAETVHRLTGPPPDLGGVDPVTRELIADCWNRDPGARPTPDAILTRFAEGVLRDSGAGPGAGGPGGTIAAGGDDLAFSLWDAATGEPVTTVNGGFHVDALAFSPDGGLLAVGGSYTDVVLWDPQTEENVATLGSTATEIAFSPDGRTVATAIGATRLWDVETGEQTATLDEADNDVMVTALAFSPDGATVATAEGEGPVRLWDAETGEETAAFEHDDYVFSLAFSPDGAVLAAGTETEAEQGAVLLWDAESGEEESELHHDGRVDSVAFHPDGGMLASGGADIAVWDTGTGRPIAEHLAGGTWTRSVAFSPDGTVLAAGGEDGIVRTWGVEAAGTATD
ncbi:WD40 repeat domain-containing serine/threonine protein kinase [Streptomonospora nanhaiensis]|uniref:WD40 repeat domain-containing serine/threonine protein kinase n=1 Tax=Streptomonospora nanhaiensis TaxID=1323731 RepID=UPI0027E0A982|nr:serine/threonine-protein kinase [Streptomonospora nanhaiensis]